MKKSSLKQKDKKRLKASLKELKKNAKQQMGYPVNGKINDKWLKPFLNISLNNIGTPEENAYLLNSHEFEKEVVETYAHLARAQKRDVWGYVTSGGTEGNEYGIYLARMLFPKGIVYYSEATHYSVPKILEKFGASFIKVKCQQNGEIDYTDLAEIVARHRDIPPIIVANIGTTMMGAVDNLDIIRDILKNIGIDDYYIHADAALSGMILPFVDDPQPFGFDAGIDSISVSGHKMIGASMPCGIVLAKKAHIEAVKDTRGKIEYINSFDTTLSGSRNGLSPLILWRRYRTLQHNSFRKKIKKCLKVADYAISQFEKAGIYAWRNKNSLTVIFPKTNANALKKWQIAVSEEIAHAIIKPHVTKHMVDKMIVDLLAEERTQWAHNSILIRVKDCPGELEKVTHCTSENGINIDSIHTVQQDKTHTFIAIGTKQNNEARELLKDIMVH